jgi:hypothetical protein
MKKSAITKVKYSRALRLLLLMALPLLFGACQTTGIKGENRPAFGLMPASCGTGKGHVLVKGWPLVKDRAYNVYVSCSPGKDFVKANSRPIDSLSIVVNGGVVGKRYYFRLTQLARDGEGWVESLPTSDWGVVAKAESQ